MQNIAQPNLVTLYLGTWVPHTFANRSLPTPTGTEKSCSNIRQNTKVRKFCWWLDSNCGPLLLAANALPTEPQPLPYIDVLVLTIRSFNALIKSCFMSTLGNGFNIEFYARKSLGTTYLGISFYSSPSTTKELLHIEMVHPKLHWQKSFATKFSTSYTDKNGAMAKSK